MKLMYSFALSFLLLMANLAWAGDKIAYQNWIAELGGKTNEAYTIADPNTSFGSFCSGEQCLFYLHQSFACSPGAKYSVLMNSPSVSTALTMECTVINGNVFQILSPFEVVLKATQVGDTIGFAVALQSGAFAVTRFSLVGAKPAIERVLVEAATSKQREQKEQKETPKLAPPPVQMTPKSTPNLNQKAPSKDISI
ncbi:hypothetical protein [Polynucleobacter sp. AP-Kolm-20A-A1]|uniref:hypothetical protein n=1 Tax=Polynucleobacter sp. AP-Kolm-20A-A1 TaxID=2081041 RepID=UPI001BFD1A5A|nr:hypothetical protein [Polynucleobacter sp. AP-Kolm-20A-A1]QWE19881.1 hypothetical protein C2745_05580 [Polynucleobacter sp. AP-Kolm-20A-A1]